MPFTLTRWTAIAAIAASASACQSLPWAEVEEGRVAAEVEAAPEIEEPSASVVATPRLKPDPTAVDDPGSAIDAHVETAANAAPIPAPAGFPPSRLIGASREIVRGRLGAPNAIRVDAPAVTWLYESSDCALSVSFYSTVDGIEYKALQYRVSARESALRQEAPFDDLDCVRSILTNNRP